MGETSLVITRRVLEQVEIGGDNQKQIALPNSSQDIRNQLKSINFENKKTIRLGNSIPLIVGDTGAIWRTHNEDRFADFDEIFNLLSRRPDEEFRIMCHIE